VLFMKMLLRTPLRKFESNNMYRMSARHPYYWEKLQRHE
jgi:hypothetical protein